MLQTQNLTKYRFKHKIKIKEKTIMWAKKNKTDPDRLLHVDVAWDLFIRNKGSYIKYVVADGRGGVYIITVLHRDLQQ